MEENILRAAVSQNIARLRKEAGLTQFELSEKINYSDKSVSKWERGEGLPDLPTIVALSELFGVSVNDIIYERSADTPEPELEASATEPPHSAPRERKLTVRTVISTLLFVCIIWIVAALTICLLGVLLPSASPVWIPRITLYALTLSFILWFILAAVGWPMIWQMISASGIAWSAALALHITFNREGILLVYAIAAAVQLMTLSLYALKLLRKKQNER